MTVYGDRLITPASSWTAMQDAFQWPQVSQFNIAEAICEKWARHHPKRRAISHLRSDGEVQDFSYGDLSRASNQLANALVGRGLKRGDRCAILLPQSPETLISHLACYKAGIVALPLFTLFGEDGLQFRLSDAGAGAIVTDIQNLRKILSIQDKLPDLKVIYCIDGGEEGGLDFWEDMARAATGFQMVETRPDDPAFLSYTSGTTGPPKGALHAHRVLLGHLPGVELHHNFFPQQGDCAWTPADWAWMGGLLNMAFPALYFGVPLIAHRMAKFDPEEAFHLMRSLGVHNSFLPPTALKIMRQVGRPVDLHLRSVCSGGEALGAELLAWGREAFGLSINEIYGQTECNLVLGNCAEIMAPRAGSTGRAVPGSKVAILDGDGQELPVGTVGEIGIHRSDFAMFLGYWNQPEKTQEKFTGDWLRSGDLAEMDQDGFVYFASRDDDVISSAGYRIGPGEIEECLSSHADVVMAAVIGVPDPIKGEAVKAFVVLRQGAAWAGLEQILIDLVKQRVSPHVAPKQVVVAEALPMTATGKIKRRDLREQ